MRSIISVVKQWQICAMWNITGNITVTFNIPIENLELWVLKIISYIDSMSKITSYFQIIISIVKVLFDEKIFLKLYTLNNSDQIF